MKTKPNVNNLYVISVTEECGFTDHECVEADSPEKAQSLATPVLKGTKTTIRNVGETLEYLQEEHHAQWCNEYGEPGYDQPETGIIFANWHDIDKDIQDALEEAGYELEWGDEWLICGQGKAWRTSPTSYDWSPSYMVTDGGDIITSDDGAVAFIEECAITDHAQPTRALPGWVTASDLEDAGFIQVNDDPYEDDWFPGQTVKPEDIARDLFENHNALEVVFQIHEISQFYTRFNVWIKKENQDD